MVIPSGNPWLRAQAPSASPEDRLEMCVLALDDLSDALQTKTSVVDLEVRRSGPTFAIETIHQLRAFFLLDSYTLILGSDAASQFDRWHRSADLKKLVDILVVRRPGENKSAFSEVNISALDISATQVRELLDNDQDLSQYLSPSVYTYIKERGLYGSK